MRIEADAEVLMSHIVSTKGGFVSPETTTYRLQSAQVRRPASGVGFGHMICLSCGKPQRLRVHDIESTRKRRLRAVVVAVVGALVLAAAVLAVFRWGDEHSTVAAVSGVVIALAFLTLYMGALSAARENGVVVRVRDADQLHSVLPLYTAFGWRRHERKAAAPTTFAYEED